jgi:hypothetical protein
MKKFVFSLLITMICSNITAQDENHFKEVQYNPETGKFSRAKTFVSESFSSAISYTGQKLAGNRVPEHDLHVQIQIPRSNKKLEVNASQLAHIVGIGLSITSMKPTIEKGMASKELFLYPANLSIYNASALLFFTYRFIAGQEKMPFKIVDQEETAA